MIGARGVDELAEEVDGTIGVGDGGGVGWAVGHVAIFKNLLAVGLAAGVCPVIRHFEGDEVPDVRNEESLGTSGTSWTSHPDALNGLLDSWLGNFLGALSGLLDVFLGSFFGALIGLLVVFLGNLLLCEKAGDVYGNVFGVGPSHGEL